MTSNTEIVKAVLGAYVEGDRETIESLIADEFCFTSPYDNRIDRKTYFERCWPLHEKVADMKFLRAIENGDEVVITYEGTGTDGKVFHNTEILTVRNGKVHEVEVYFGWDVPHKAPEGGFIDPA